jgi:hypothetical protein
MTTLKKFTSHAAELKVIAVEIAITVVFLRWLGRIVWHELGL